MRATKMKIDPARFRVAPQKKVRLRRWPTRVKPYYGSKAEYEQALGRHVAELSSLSGYKYDASAITIFKSLGLGLEDVAAGGFVFEQAVQRKVGRPLYS